MNRFKIVTLITIVGLLCIAAYYGNQHNSKNRFDVGFLCPDKPVNFEFVYESGGSTDGSLMTAAHIGAGQSSILAKGDLTLNCEKGRSSIKFNSFEYEAKGILNHSILLEGKEITIGRDKAGTVVHIDFPESFSFMDMYVSRDIITHTSIKAEKPVTNWDSKEEDTNGQYHAHYTFFNDKLIKTRKNYYFEREDYVKSTSSREVEIDKGETEFKIKNQSLIGLESQLAINFLLEGKKIARNSSSLSLKLSNTKVAISASPKAIHPNNKRMVLSYKEDQKRLKRVLEKNALGADTFDTIISKLQEAKEDEYTSIFLKLKALLVLYPNEAEKFVDILLESNFESSKFHLISSVLSHVSSEKSQYALTQALKNHSDHKSRIALIGDLGITPNPTNHSEEVLRDYRDNSDNPDIKQTINLALGNMARSIKSKSQSRYDRTLRDSLASLISCGSFESCINALHVLGNIGAPETLDVAKRFLDSKDPTIRAVAISSLRFIDLPIIEKMMLNKVISDSDAKVRKAAAHELSFRRLEDHTIETLLARMENETSEAVRLGMLKASASDIKRIPRWVSIVSDISTNDSSQAVRDMASDIVM